MDYFAGLDASLETVNVCIVDGEGSVLLEQKVGAIFSRANSIRLMLFSMNGTLLGRETNRHSKTELQAFQD